MKKPGGARTVDWAKTVASVGARHLNRDLQRDAVIAEYASLSHPTRLLAQVYATRLGLKEAQFYNLLRQYRTTGSIVATEPSKRGAFSALVAPEVDAAIAAAIRATGHDAPLADVVKASAAKCSEQGLRLPSINAIQTRLKRARRAGTGSENYPTLVLDRVALELNVATDAGPVAAWLSVLIHSPSAQVLGHCVSVGRAGPKEAALAVLIAIGEDGRRGLPTGAANDAIALFRDFDPDWQTLSEALTSAGLLVVGPTRERVSVGNAAFRLLGDRIGRIYLRPRLKPGEPAGNGGSGLDFRTVEVAVDYALSPRRADDRCEIGGPALQGLASALSRLVQRPL